MNSGDQPDSRSLGPEEARKALEELHARPDKDVSHPDWLPPLVNENIRRLAPGEITIGAWLCDLNNKTFQVSVEFPGAHRHRINSWTGVFERTAKGGWRARIVGGFSVD
jgi:hypothetical protein